MPPLSETVKGHQSQTSRRPAPASPPATAPLAPPPQSSLAYGFKLN